MSTTFDVLDVLYQHLNVPAITGTIDGRIYRHKKPLNSVKRDIVLVPLPLLDGENIDVQPGTVSINCYAKNLDKGIIDEQHLSATVDAIIAQLEAFSMSTSYFDIEIVSQNVMQDVDQPEMSYASIRINIIIE